jgi:hypothetical protein
MKIQLLQKRREELRQETDYGDSGGEAEDEDVLELSAEEQEYLLSLLKGGNIQEEDAELVLTLMREYSTDVIEFIPMLIRDFPGLAKRLYYFCNEVEDKTGLVTAVKNFVDEAGHITEYQLFWFAKMLEDYLLSADGAGNLLMALYEHEDATNISKAKILEIPDKRFGLSDLREEQLRTGHSDWLSWSSAVGARVHAKGQRNQLLKYFRKSSPMNRFIGEFVETCF